MKINRQAIKRNRQNAKHQLRNVAYKSMLKTMVKNVSKSVQNKNILGSQQLLVEAYSKFDKAASKGIIKQNKARRYKSKVGRLVSTLALNTSENE